MRMTALLSAGAQLSGGIALIPALIGAFGFSEILMTLMSPTRAVRVKIQDSVLPRFREVVQYWPTVLRSGVIGVADRVDAGHRRGCRRLDVLCRGPCHQP